VALRPIHCYGISQRISRCPRRWCRFSRLCTGCDIGHLFASNDFSLAEKYKFQATIELEYPCRRDAEQLPFPNQSFELIIAAHCLEHFRSP